MDKVNSKVEPNKSNEPDEPDDLFDVPSETGAPSASYAHHDFVENIIGAFGKYQFLLCILIFASKFPVAFHQMAIIFLAPKTAYICETTGNATCPCSKPIYDTSIFTDTIIMEWNLICEKEWLASLTQTLFQLGTLAGSVVFGMISDAFGRRYPLIFAEVLKVLMGIAAAYASNFWAFTIIRCIIGMSVGGSIVISFVVIMEFIGTEYRDTVSALYHVPFNLGHMMLPGFAYFFRDYEHFQLAISLPTIVLLSYICLLPETPRWLIAMNRSEEAIAILERIATMNKRPTANIRSDVERYEAALAKNITKKGTIVDLFRYPNMRKNIIAMSFNWLTCSYVFYGVSQYVGHLSGNIFVNVALSATMTLVGTLTAIPLFLLMGRKTILIIFNFICAVFLLILMFTPSGIESVICATIVVVSSFIVFVVVYLYCSELFPTVVRNAAIGVASMSARVGSMIAPFVVRLESKGHWIPPFGFAIMPLAAGFVSFALPETKGVELMNTIQEGEEFGKKPKTYENN